jgi:uncharacterized small protein (DUF1192 family)
MSEKITYIYPEDLAALEQDADGNYIVPDGFEIYRVPTLKEQMQRVRDEVARLEALPVPTDSELLEWSKQNHPYYIDMQIIDSYREQLRNADNV